MRVWVDCTAAAHPLVLRPIIERLQGAGHEVSVTAREYAGLQRQLAFRVARRALAPDAIPIAAMRRAGATPRKLFRYPGLKEDYYLADFRPHDSVLGELGIDRDRILVVIRPPPETSAYHADNPLYERL